MLRNTDLFLKTLKIIAEVKAASNNESVKFFRSLSLL